jgi:predicted nucleic acid-binding protein
MLLDSNILIYGADGGNPSLDAILDRKDLAAASVTRIETLGYHRLSQIQRVWLETTFERMRILPLDDAVTARAITLRQEQKMDLADAIIAATALVHNMPLVTGNVEDFRHITALRVVNPFSTAS